MASTKKGLDIHHDMLPFAVRILEHKLRESIQGAFIWNNGFQLQLQVEQNGGRGVGSYFQKLLDYEYSLLHVSYAHK